MMIGYIDIDLPRDVSPVREPGPKAELPPSARAALRAVGTLLSGPSRTAPRSTATRRPAESKGLHRHADGFPQASAPGGPLHGIDRATRWRPPRTAETQGRDLPRRSRPSSS